MQLFQYRYCNWHLCRTKVHILKLHEYVVILDQMSKLIEAATAGLNVQ